MRRLLAGLAAVFLASTATQAQEAQFPGWNIEYTMPPEWRPGQDLGRVKTLVSNSEAGGIFLAPGLYSNFNEMIVDITRFYQTMSLAAQPVEPPTQTTIAGFQAMTSLYVSQDRMGQMVQSRIVAMLTPHGTGFVILGMTTPQQMSQLRQRVDQLAASVRAQPPVVNRKAIAALRGRWMFYEGRAGGVTRPSGGGSRSVEEYVTFDGQGQFQWQSSASVSATGSLGGGTAGAASSNSDRGTYTVIGNTLVTKGQQGQQAFQLQILGDRIISDGRTYLRAN